MGTMTILPLQGGPYSSSGLRVGSSERLSARAGGGPRSRGALLLQDQRVPILGQHAASRAVQRCFFQPGRPFYRPPAGQYAVLVATVYYLTFCPPRMWEVRSQC